MSHAPGPDRLTAALAGRYRITKVAGRGGMATVYVADDLRHGRQVAIKVLKEELGDAIGAERFLREIEIAARLTHPHIMPLHDSGEADGLLYYVMPFLGGDSLRERLERERQLPLQEAVRLIDEMADALGYAHDLGVIHRDIKPENVLLSGGHAVISDFGIARAVEGAGPRVTQTGIAVGTPAYMSPEQGLADHTLDRRTDIYALGCVLYEMLGGEPPFMGSSPRAVISRHTRDPVPPLRTLRPTVPQGLQDAVERALAKDPVDRYASAPAFAVAVRRAAVGPPSADSPNRARWSVRDRRILIGAGIVLVAAASGAVAITTSGRWDDASAAPVRVTDVVKLTWEGGVESSPSLSRDGQWIAYEKGGDIYLRRVGGSAAVNLTAGSSAWDGQPAFSPDGKHIAFASRREGGETRGGIWLIEATGGSARRLSRAGFDPAWSPDGREVSYTTEYVSPLLGRVRESELRSVHLSSGADRRVGEADAVTAAWSPQGLRIAYTTQYLAGQPPGKRDIWTVSADGTDPRPVTDDMAPDGYPVWSPDGRHLYYARGENESWTYWRVPIDERTGQLRDAPSPVALPAAVVSKLSIASDGVRAAYESFTPESNVWRVAFDPEAGAIRGEPIAVTSGSRFWEDVDVSPDGRLVLSHGRRELFLADSLGEDLQVIPAARGDRTPRWSRDGTRIAFTSSRDTTSQTWTMRGDGSEVRPLTRFDSIALFFPQWSPDGSRVTATAGVGFGALTFVIDASDRPGAKLDSLPLAPGDPGLRYRPWSWSANGRYLIAYSQRGGGLAAFDFTTRRWQVLTRSGDYPRWMQDSRRVVYSLAGRLMLLDTGTGRTRELLTMPGYSLERPALGPHDRSIYFVRSRAEGDIWMARVSP